MIKDYKKEIEYKLIHNDSEKYSIFTYLFIYILLFFYLFHYLYS